MRTARKILIADQDEAFAFCLRESLTSEGFVCDFAPRAGAAAQQLSQGGYELAIIDAQLPGNSDLELIRTLPEFDRKLRAILISRSPSLRSALDAIQLPVSAYLVKPFDYGQLQPHVRRCISQYRATRSLEQARAVVEEEMAGFGVAPEGASAAAFAALTLRNIQQGLRGLQRLVEGLAEAPVGSRPEACEILNCPRGTQLKELLEETVEVLERSRSSFKSKELGALRKRISEAIRPGRPSPHPEEN